MSRRVFVHVGLPKSGTSYLQRLLGANRDPLRSDARVLFPGPTWEQQVLAVRDLRGLGGGARAEGAWPRLVGALQEWDGDAVISMEWLCAASEDEIGRLLTDLAPAQVEVVFTARDLGRTLTAAWQEFVQNRSTWPWDEFLDSVVRADGSNPGRAFWAQQDLPALVRRWSGMVAPERVHVVVVPPPGAPPTTLWERFAQVLDLGDVAMSFETRQANESLGLESTELLRRLNALTHDRLDRPTYMKLYKHTLAKGILARRRPSESALVVPEEHHAWVSRVAGEHVEGLRLAGVPVVGDPEELRPILRSDGRQPHDLTDGELLGAAETAILGLAERLGKAQEASARRPTGGGRPAPAPRHGLSRLLPRRASRGQG